MSEKWSNVYVGFLVAFILVVLGFYVGLAVAPGGEVKTKTVKVPAQAVTFAPPESAARPDGFTPASVPLKPPSFAISPQHISTDGLHLIEGFEGFSSCPYWDSYGGVWTRGYGETEGIYGGSACISKAYGENNLRYRIERFYEWAIRGIGVPFNQHQFDALCSFAWNLGAGIFRGSLRESLRHYNAQPLLQYVHAGGVTLPGLVTRRRAEVRLFYESAPKPVDRAALKARQRTLRRVLLRYGCISRRDHRQALGPKCRRWFREGNEIHRILGG